MGKGARGKVLVKGGLWEEEEEEEDGAENKSVIEIGEGTREVLAKAEV